MAYPSKDRISSFLYENKAIQHILRAVVHPVVISLRFVIYFDRSLNDRVNTRIEFHCLKCHAIIITPLKYTISSIIIDLERLENGNSFLFAKVILNNLILNVWKGYKSGDVLRTLKSKGFLVPYPPSYNLAFFVKTLKNPCVFKGTSNHKLGQNFKLQQKSSKML